ncbi:rhophilin-2 isoform X2 [Danaus plexippus]|uniref:rhophilin-2 isoform X2 n=1 Tax=Danaus plexippus TaxID=13037 RepID=UPI0013C4CFFA|nr:rhophilin-2 isoform X2 [Danaus plexippus]
MMKISSVIMGSDPRVATCRGRLQTRRCQLNQEINKELRLRAGAENLFKATTNRKLRETVALELSFVNSNLQLLKEQLAELNSSVELYQNDSKECVMPMIPLGLKETKEVDFREPFKDFILEHYSEDAAAYDDAISDFMDMRQATRTPVRSSAGVALLFKYYNQLYYIERRFFPPDRSLGVYFEWFDSLTGVPSCQRTVAFEKACVLFNIAGIYTQIGAKQERFTCSGLDGSVDALLRAAGALRYIHENFTNAPSVDLAADTLLVLGALMTAQARECLFEKLQLQASECRDQLGDQLSLDLAQEAARLADTYRQLYEKMQTEGVINYVPYSWVSLVHVKAEFYRAVSHEYCAAGLLAPEGPPGDRLRDLYQPDGHGEQASCESSLPALGRAHLAEALAAYEEALRLQRMCRELRNKQSLSRLMSVSRERAAGLVAPPADDFDDLIDAPHIAPSSKFQLALTPPDFSQHRVEDLFRSLGPIAVFSAKRHWSAPRLVTLHRHAGGPRRRDGAGDDDYVTKQNGVYISSFDGEYHRSRAREAGRAPADGEGFGFTVRGDAPVMVAAVEQDSLADMAGMRPGDFIMSVGDRDVKWSSHEEVVRLTRAAGDRLTLRLASPMDQGAKSSPNGGRQSRSNQGSVSAASTSSGSTAAARPRRAPSWNPFKKNGARDNSQHRHANLVYR